MKMYQQLIVYRNENEGSTRVPQNDMKYLKLGRWVASQRTKNNSNNIYQDRKSLLDSIDFDWGKKKPPPKNTATTTTLILNCNGNGNGNGNGNDRETTKTKKTNNDLTTTTYNATTSTNNNNAIDTTNQRKDTNITNSNEVSLLSCQRAPIVSIILDGNMCYGLT